MSDWVFGYLLVALAAGVAYLLLRGDIRIWRWWAEELLAAVAIGFCWLPIVLCWALRPDPGRPTWHVKNAWRRWKMRGFYWPTGSTVSPAWTRLYAPNGKWVLLSEAEDDALWYECPRGKWEIPEVQEHLAKIWEMAQARIQGVQR